MSSATACLTLQLLACLLCLAEEDYYQIFSISRDATDRDIRKAFKKLALERHPDKNPDDPKAHENFVKLNEIYEVLKDPDLRRTYDLHGEEGLKDQKKSGGNRYESWSFYKNDFGLYDDDDEILTFSGWQQFQQVTRESGENWFVNFYSPRCSHCHDLAPDWRKLAKALDGAVKFGAVNCGDNWNLCSNVGIRGYPSLILYPKGIRFNGDRVFKELSKFVLQNVPSQVIELSRTNLASYQSQRAASTYPLNFLVSFCDGVGDCMSSVGLTRLSIMLKSIIHVAYMDCSGKNEDWCHEKYGLSSGTMYFNDRMLDRATATSISALDADDVMHSLLPLLPPLPEVDQTLLDEHIESNAIQPGLLLYVYDRTMQHPLEMRRLRRLMGGGLAVANCAVCPAICRQYHIHTFPQIIALKTESRDYEFYHGRFSPGLIEKFARKSFSSSVKAITPSSFPKDLDKWLIDFYSPHCPPCLNLLPELRTLSTQRKDMKFGTVDCTVHDSLCRRYRINSYPTTILFNDTEPHRTSGFKDVAELKEYIEDIQSPSVVALDYDSFQQRVVKRGPKEIWAVDFFAPWCGHCQQIAPLWRKLARAMIGEAHIGSVDCTVEGRLCDEFNIRSYPSILAFPPGKGGNKFAVYRGWFDSVRSVRFWVLSQLPRASKDLTSSEFASVHTNKKPYIVDFHSSYCGPCKNFAPEFEKLAEQIKVYSVASGKVDCQRSHRDCTTARIRNMPTVLFYAGDGKTVQEIPVGNIQSMVLKIRAVMRSVKRPDDEL